MLLEAKQSNIDEAGRDQSALLFGIPDGVAGVRATINLMSRLARQYKVHPEIIATARRIVVRLPEKDYLSEAAAIQEWVRDNIRYTRDVEGVETLATPIDTLATRHGDCDDKALLAGALLLAIGHPVRFVAWAFEGPEAFEHVYAEVKYNQHWLGVETTEPVALGWKPESAFRPMIANT